jgi:hypothetical protein
MSAVIGLPKEAVHLCGVPLVPDGLCGREMSGDTGAPSAGIIAVLRVAAVSAGYENRVRAPPANLTP